MAGSAPGLAICAEKERLHRDYSVAVSDYQRAFAVMSERVGMLKKGEYENIRSYIEKAREKSEDARLALDRHIAEHGC